MQEIANRFKEEYTELLSRYKEHLTNAQIMSILQSVTRKQIGIKDNPERFKGLDYAKGFPVIDEIQHLQTERDFEGIWKSVEEAQHMIAEGALGRDAVAGIKHTCSPQEIAEADCCGDVYKCKNACGKLRMNTTTLSDAPEFHIGEYFDDQEGELNNEKD